MIAEIAKSKNVSLGDLFEIKHGYAFKGEFFGTKGTHVVLTPGNFFDQGGFKQKGDKEKWYSGEIPADYILQKGDLLVAMTEQAEGLLGSAAIVPKSDLYLHNQRLGLIQNMRGIDSRFLYYTFNSETVRQQIRSTCSGVKVRHTSPSRIYEVKAPIPDLPTQRKIAGILSAYDDLIENNLRRIKILEQMAQSLYREWFVHFRFPGHESATFKDSELGRIPEGWEVKPLFDLATVKYGKMLPKKDLVEDGDYPVYGAAKIIGRHTTFTCSERTIICGCRGSVGEMQITLPQCYVTNNSFTFDPTRSELFFWLFYSLSARGLRDVTGGAAQPQITLDGISQVHLAVPEAHILKEFEHRARSLAELKWNLADRNEILRRTRDLLLPKLLSPANQEI